MIRHDRQIHNQKMKKKQRKKNKSILITYFKTDSKSNLSKMKFAVLHTIENRISYLKKGMTWHISKTLSV